MGIEPASEFGDFTRGAYRSILRLAKRHYEFVAYDDITVRTRKVFWRHDIDLSPHSARKLAIIEAEEKVKTTYFVNLHSEFYNLLESSVTECIRQILALGHDLGLHFDSHFWKTEDQHRLAEHLIFEADILETLFGCKIRVFSFHNPTEKVLADFREISYAGLINTYSDYFRTQVGYVSDSNGFWRYRSLLDVLNEAKESEVQVLTHPGWWQDEAMSPRSRVQRCIDDRATRTAEYYDAYLQRYGRSNIR